MVDPRGEHGVVEIRQVSPPEAHGAVGIREVSPRRQDVVGTREVYPRRQDVAGIREVYPRQHGVDLVVDLREHAVLDLREEVYPPEAPGAVAVRGNCQTCQRVWDLGRVLGVRSLGGCRWS